MVKISDFVRVPKTRVYNKKRYKLRDSFVSKETAQRLKARYRKQGYSVRIVQQGGVMHFHKRFHIYIRKG